METVLPAAGGAAGEADGFPRLQLGGGKVAAVQPDGGLSGPSAPAAPRAVQRLPRAGLRLRAALHAGLCTRSRPQTAEKRCQAANCRGCFFSILNGL